MAAAAKPEHTGSLDYNDEEGERNNISTTTMRRRSRTDDDDGHQNHRGGGEQRDKSHGTEMHTLIGEVHGV